MEEEDINSFSGALGDGREVYMLDDVEGDSTVMRGLFVDLPQTLLHH